MTYRFGIRAFVVAVGFAGFIGCGSSGGLPDGGGTAGTTGSAGGGGTTGTGGGGGVPTSSGVTGTKRLDALTTADKQAICDWVAAHFGGYGQTIDCGGGTTISSDPDQASCVASAPTNCAATVSQYETCIRDQSCTNLIPASCTPFLSCS